MTVTAKPSGRSAHRACLAFALSCAASIGMLRAQPAETTPLEQVQHRVGESLYGLPDYTCRLTVRRVEALPEPRRKKRRRKADERPEVSVKDAKTVVFDVVIIDGEEHYAAPGESNLDDRPPSELVEGGLVSTGAFAAHVRDVLVNRAGTMQLAGEESVDGAMALRYDYDVPATRTAYRVTNEGQSVLAPYHGSVWITPDGSDLLRFTAEAGELPLFVGVDQVTTQIDYQTVEVEGQDLIVASRSSVRMQLSDGGWNVNETEFTDCRSFVSSSVLSF